MGSKYSKLMAETWQRCDEFNRTHPVGTLVGYQDVLKAKTSGDIKQTKTRSPAWALPSGQAVVMIEGKSGGVSLDHISPL